MERTSLIDNIVLEIRDKIVAGKFKEGDMLPSQDELARDLGVSRASLREALNRLALMGLIEAKHGSGTFVKMTTPADVMNSLASLLVMDKASAAELLQARFHIEPVVAALAAEHAGKEDIDRIRLQLEGMASEFDRGNLENFISRDVLFHIYISKASKNRVLAKVLGIIREILHQFIVKYFEKEPSSVSTAIAYHREIYKAIEQHDPGAARKHMEDHIASLVKRLMENDISWE